MTDGVADINAVKREQRKSGRESAGGPAMGLHKHFMQVRALSQHLVGAQAPVVEVARCNHRSARRYVLMDEVTQQVHLLQAMRFGQAQVHANHVQMGDAARHLQYTVQQAPPFGPADGRVAVAEIDDRKLGQHGVAMVALGVDGVAAIGKLGPDAVGQKLVMGGGRVVGEPACMRDMAPADFLQKHHVGRDAANGLAQLMQDEFAVEETESLVDVDGEHLDRKAQRRRGNRELGLDLRIDVVVAVRDERCGVAVNGVADFDK